MVSRSTNRAASPRSPTAACSTTGRGELLDTGLARLERSATAALGSPMQDFAQQLVTDLVAGGPADDVCVLAAARREGH